MKKKLLLIVFSALGLIARSQNVTGVWKEIYDRWENRKFILILKGNLDSAVTGHSMSILYTDNDTDTVFCSLKIEYNQKEKRLYIEETGVIPGKKIMKEPYCLEKIAVRFNNKKRNRLFGKTENIDINCAPLPGSARTKTVEFFKVN